MGEQPPSPEIIENQRSGRARGPPEPQIIKKRQLAKSAKLLSTLRTEKQLLYDILQVLNVEVLATVFLLNTAMD